MSHESFAAKPPLPQVARLRAEEASGSDNSLRKFAFYAAVGLTFIRCSLIQELLTYELHFDVYLLYVFGLFTVIGIFASGSFTRLFRFRPGYYWIGYAVWMTLAVPFSIWKGMSFPLVMDYWRTNMVMLVALGTLVTTWEECKVVIRTLALSCIGMLLIVRFFSQLDVNGRLNLKFSLVANSNDYPAHLLLLMPALLWVASTTKSVILRIIMLGAFGYGLYVILASGSRGALIAVGVAVIYYLFSASNKQRIAALSIGVAMLAIAFSLLSDEAVHRLFSFSETTSSQSSEATQSEESRTQLLEDSIMFALKNPIFGVGPGDFSVAEGESRKGFWLEPHNSYTEVACECGIPAFIFLLGGIFSSFGILRRIGREWGKDVRAKEFTQAAFFLRLSMVAFCSAIFFLNFAYLLHLPMIGGISIAMGYANEDWKSRLQSAPPDTQAQTGANLSRTRAQRGSSLAPSLVKPLQAK